jgi:transcriptional/translational regulatory protein YebC/TACO1
MVTMCVKAGGSDPVSNPQLSKLLQQAKQAGVPVANMDNCIKRASSKDQADYKENTYEVYAHGGIGFVLDILTDNNNR